MSLPTNNKKFNVKNGLAIGASGIQVIDAQGNWVGATGSTKPYGATGSIGYTGDGGTTGVIGASGSVGDQGLQGRSSLSGLEINAGQSGGTLLVTNGNTTVTAQGYQQSAITNTAINDGDQKWFSVYLDTVIDPATTTIGIANQFYNNTSFIGSDDHSIGFSGNGFAYSLSGAFQSGLPTFGSGDTVDIAVYFAAGQVDLWIRVNGGLWNNNPAADPATASNPITINSYSGGSLPIYPALGPANTDTLTLRTSASYANPDGYTFLPASSSVNTGYTGATGAQGVTGDSGIDGASGVTGDAGVDGASGVTGQTGVDGASGPTGNQGPTGETGATGGFGGYLAGTWSFDPSYTNFDLADLYNGNNSIEDNDSGFANALGTIQLDNSSGSYQYMFSIHVDTVHNNGSFIGIASHNANINDSNYFLGLDTNSAGFAFNGEYWYNGGVQSGSLPTWGAGDVVDIAVDQDSGFLWIRVNGGDWNNDPTANPSNSTGGLSTYSLDAPWYPAVSIYGVDGATALTIREYAQYTVPSGTLNFTFLPGGIQAIQGYTGASGVTGEIGATGSNGARYHTTSSTTLSLTNTGATGAILNDDYLNYSVGQTIILEDGGGKHIHATVDSYDAGTKILAFTPYDHVGNGTSSSWEINLSAAEGAAGASGITGYDGATGPDGEAGYQGTNFNSRGIIGDDGTQGIDGHIGDTGVIGPDGEQGSQGIDGNIGYTGVRGPTGVIGETGVIGDTGQDGYTGYMGASGATGYAGATGVTGDDGVQGYTGASGATGADGYVGNQGYTGDNGEQGIFGSTGLTGSTGPTGEAGSNGLAGATGSDGSEYVAIYAYTSTIGGGIGIMPAYLPDGVTLGSMIYIDNTVPLDYEPFAGMVVEYNSVAYTVAAWQDSNGDSSRLFFTNIVNTGDIPAGIQIILEGYTKPLNIGATGITGASGVTGETGANADLLTYGNARGVWDPYTAYDVDDIVVTTAPSDSHRCIVANTGNNPDSTSGYWQVTAWAGASGASGYTGASGVTGYVGVDGATGSYGNRFRATLVAGDSGYYIGEGGGTGDLVLQVDSQTQDYSYSFSAGQTVIIYKDANNYATALVNSYDNVSGALNVTFETEVGSSTTSDTLYINLDGAVGPQGASGATGYTGATGPTGEIGDTGILGDDGTVGLDGATGVTGSTGPTGDQGSNGYIGATGVDGEQGYIGNTGDIGLSGLQGDTGSTGYTGLQGFSLVTGSTGLSGTSQQTVNQFASNEVGTAKYLVQGVDSFVNVQATEVIITQNPSGVWMTEYATLRTGDKVMDVTATTNGSVVSLKVTPIDSTTTVSWVREDVKGRIGGTTVNDPSGFNQFNSFTNADDGAIPSGKAYIYPGSYWTGLINFTSLIGTNVTFGDAGVGPINPAEGSIDTWDGMTLVVSINTGNFTSRVFDKITYGY